MPPKRRLSTSEGGGEDEGITALDGGKKKKKMDISTLMQVFLIFKIPAMQAKMHVKKMGLGRGKGIVN